MFEFWFAVKFWWYLAREKRRTRKNRLDSPVIGYLRYLWD